MFVEQKPPTWKRGPISIVVSRAPYSSVRAPFIAPHQMLSCDITTPLGKPVVPDVYMIAATSEPVTAGNSGSGSADAAVSSGHCAPLATPNVARSLGRSA